MKISILAVAAMGACVVAAPIQEKREAQFGDLPIALPTGLELPTGLGLALPTGLIKNKRDAQLLGLPFNLPLPTGFSLPELPIKHKKAKRANRYLPRAVTGTAPVATGTAPVGTAPVATGTVGTGTAPHATATSSAGGAGFTLPGFFPSIPLPSLPLALPTGFPLKE